MNRIRLVLSLLLWIGVATAARAEVSPQKAALIRKMIEVTQMSVAVEHMKSSLLAMAFSGSDLPPEFKRRFAEKLTWERLLDAYLPIYDRFYTEDDCEAIIAFYSSPVGRKLASNQIAIATELGTAGGKLGEQIAGEVIAELRAEKHQPGR